jgi:hypothetical protein
VSAPVDPACPACGAEVHAAPGARFTCPGCGAELLRPPGEAALERAVAPALDAEQARAAFRRLFHNDGEPEAEPDAIGVELYFVPFYELTGTIAGVAPDGRAVHRWAQASLLAVEDRDDLGPAAIDPGRAADARTLEAGPGAGHRLSPATQVLLPEAERDEALAILGEQARMPADGDDPVLVDRRLTLLHYPVYRLRYSARGLVYQATVDGITGTVLKARVPAKQRRRIFNGVFAAACLGYVLGTMLRRPALGLPNLGRAIARAEPQVLLPVLGLAAVGLGLYLLLLNAAFNALRYRNELVYSSGIKSRLLVNRPAETSLDRATALLKRAYARLFGARRFDT